MLSRGAAGARRLIPLLLLFAGACEEARGGGCGTAADAPRAVANPAAGMRQVEQAFAAKRSSFVVEVEGVVAKLISDDEEGARHQRFILKLASDQTLLIAHNVDLAPRAPVKVGDRVGVRGQYEWNRRGGLLHWTHHDPRGKRPGGWILHEGEAFR